MSQGVHRAGWEQTVLNNPLAPTRASRGWSENSGLEGVGVGLADEFLKPFQGLVREMCFRWASVMLTTP